MSTTRIKIPPVAPPADRSLEETRAAAAGCLACPFANHATQTVFGEGPTHASLMMVGEQPGDAEDLAGHPFVGPAGRLLNQILAEAGVPRGEVYVTNAVKHFKFERRGKFRLHQKPTSAEVKACAPWLARELALVQPRVVMALGATAAHAIFGKATPIAARRGQAIAHGGRTVVVSWHPSALLRAPDEDARARMRDELGRDLAFAFGLTREKAEA